MSSKNNVTIIGIGRLGICFGLVLANKGFSVVGIDINQNYVDSINEKKFKSNEPNVENFLKQLLH